MVVIIDGKKVLVTQGRVVIRNGVAELGLVLAIEHQGNAELGGHLGGQLLLAQNERLERVEQVLGRQTGQQTVGHAVGGTQVVIKPGVDPGLHVIPAPGGVDMRCPSHRQGVHAVFVFQDMSGIKAVLAAGAGHQAVIAAVIFAVFIAQLTQLFFAQGPVDMAVSLIVAGMAGIAGAVVLNDHRLFNGLDRMFKFIAGVRLLVAHHAFITELYMFGQAVISFQLILRDIGRVFGVIDFDITRILFHISHSHSIRGNSY